MSEGSNVSIKVGGEVWAENVTKDHAKALLPTLSTLFPTFTCVAINSDNQVVVKFKDGERQNVGLEDM